MFCYLITHTADRNLCFGSPFDLLTAPLPCYRLTFSSFSRLHKKVDDRATYPQLLEHPFLQLHRQKNTDISAFVSAVLDAPVAPENGASAAGAAAN